MEHKRSLSGDLNLQMPGHRTGHNLTTVGIDNKENYTKFSRSHSQTKNSGSQQNLAPGANQSYPSLRSSVPNPVTGNTSKGKNVLEMTPQNNTDRKKLATKQGTPRGMTNKSMVFIKNGTASRANKNTLDKQEPMSPAKKKSKLTHPPKVQEKKS